MQLQSIPAVSGIDPQTFQQRYFKPGIPVILKDFVVADCEAMQLWDLEYFKEKAGAASVAVHGSEDAHPDKVTSPPEERTTFAAYLDRIQSGPTEARLFLFNILMDYPALKKQLKVRPLAKGLLNWLPLMFFGGAGSSVRYHYDIDMSHVFLTQFQGVKKVLLFANDQSPFLYKLPFSFHGTPDLRHPDYEQYPALRHLQGYECTLEHGDTLFIPSGYWHYIQYVTAGYSVSHRALSASFAERLTGLWNILVVRRTDNLLRKLLGQRWFQYKQRVALRNAARADAQYKAAKIAERVHLRPFTDPIDRIHNAYER
ncbi:Cupin-like domain-containing protein [Chitinophaga costaii]|uniref:Cupin-like domain-containing protein n=1 Tax=Chitinophaga costaii TaxID=1335309 RepID=A0A1C4BDW7_9BACT|nr:cupin-like domain-containing protein [Chitinophaga costaii]PUZ27646.1 cupin-like domain-containing protein [Chitinophaga costaii]SCC05076.1 Cupin-like domain-containing protein [Chitinophaga costaii]